MSEEASKLACVIDGAPLSEEDAKALWKEFSAYMDANRGDMAGFAKKKGWFAIAPEYRDGKAVLVARTTATARTLPAAQAPQKPRPQQKPKPKPKQGAKPQQKAKPQPQAGQKAPPRPNQPLKPKAQGGGGQAPPRKRSV
jgi:hypothetical protein